MRFGFYGSLRKGHYNYNRLVANSGATFEGNHVLKGYEMRDFGHFPGAFKTNSEDDSIILELYDIPESENTDHIHAMEVNSGYIPTEISVNNKIYTIYAYGDGGSRYSERWNKVTNGDWTTYYEKKNGKAYAT